MPITDGTLPELERLLTREVEKAVAEAAEEAAERVRTMVKSQTANFAARLWHSMSYERRGQDLVITIKIKEGD